MLLINLRAKGSSAVNKENTTVDICCVHCGMYLTVSSHTIYNCEVSRTIM